MRHPPEHDRSSSYLLRAPRVGDLGWIVHRQAVLYHQEYGWNEHYESTVARIVADFVDHYDPERERCWVAERDGEIVGSIFCVRRSDTVAKLRMLYVEPSARGLGIGTRLVREVIDFARARGYEKVTLWTNSVLVAARRIYDGYGFRVVETERNTMFGPETVGETLELEL